MKKAGYVFEGQVREGSAVPPARWFFFWGGSPRTPPPAASVYGDNHVAPLQGAGWWWSVGYGETCRRHVPTLGGSRREARPGRRMVVVKGLRGDVPKARPYCGVWQWGKYRGFVGSGEGDFGDVDDVVEDGVEGYAGGGVDVEFGGDVLPVRGDGVG